MTAKPRYLLPVLVSLAVHGGVVALMVVGVGRQEPKRIAPPPTYVKAQLVELKERATEVSQAEASKPKVIDVSKQRRERELAAAAEAKAKAEAEAEAARKAAERKAAAAKKRKEAEAQEAERKRQEAAEQRERDLREREVVDRQRFADALAAEEAALQDTAYANAAQSYISVISERIERNWSRPPSARNGMECELLIRLVPTGRVINVDVVRSSGNTLFDRSAVQAVNRAEQFPEVQQMAPEVFERYYRELKLIFRPQDLRQ